MTRSKLVFASCLAALGLGLSSGRALAATPPELDYQAPAGCPDSASFVLAVEARGASFAAVDGDGAAAARRLLVRIEPEKAGFSGSLVLLSGREASEPRRVAGATCAEVSDALAVVTAIALQRDGEAALAPAVAAPAAPLAVPSPASSPRAVAPPAAESGGPPELVMAPKDVLVPSGTLELDYVTTYTMTAGVQLGAIPGVLLPRLDFDIARTNVVRAPDARAFVLGTEFRWRWTLLGVPEREASGYESSLFGLKLGIGGCRRLTYDPGGLIFKVCSDFAVGMIDVTTRPTDGGAERQKRQGLATAGVEANLQYNLSQLFHLDLRAGGEMWLNRISAEREDGSRLFQSPLFNAYLMVGVGIHL